MKTFLITLSLFLGAVACKGQYYNPYTQQQLNQQAYNMGVAAGMVQNGLAAVANGNYTRALELFEQAYDDYRYIPALECAALCYELGIGCQRDTDWAYKLYKEGASYSHQPCLTALNRIRNNGFYPASYRSTYLKNFKANYAANYGGGGGYSSPGTSGGSSSGKSSTYAKCRICGGSGVCTSCNGAGGSWEYPAFDTSISPNKRWISCPSCKGSKKCFNCHGTGHN